MGQLIRNDRNVNKRSNLLFFWDRSCSNIYPGQIFSTFECISVIRDPKCKIIINQWDSNIIESKPDSWVELTQQYLWYWWQQYKKLRNWEERKVYSLGSETKWNKGQFYNYWCCYRQNFEKKKTITKNWAWEYIASKLWKNQTQDRVN